MLRMFRVTVIIIDTVEKVINMVLLRLVAFLIMAVMGVILAMRIVIVRRKKIVAAKMLIMRMMKSAIVKSEPVQVKMVPVVKDVMVIHARIVILFVSYFMARNLSSHTLFSLGSICRRLEFVLSAINKRRVKKPTRVLASLSYKFTENLDTLHKSNSSSFLLFLLTLSSSSSSFHFFTLVSDRNKSISYTNLNLYFSSF